MVEDLLNEIKKLEGRVKDLETSTQRIARIEKENRKLTERVDMLECALREMNESRQTLHHNKTIKDLYRLDHNKPLIYRHTQYDM